MTNAIKIIMAAMCCVPAYPLHAGDIVATAVAVPVGVPVAQVAPVQYQLQSHSQGLSESDLNRLADKIAARMGGNKVQALGVNPQQLFTAKCVVCHKGDNAKGGVSLEGPIEKLDRTLRQDAVLRMVDRDPHRRMPKGQKQLSEDEYVALFRFLFL